MKPSTPLQQATEELETTVSALPGAAGISVRILKLVKLVVSELGENKSLDELGSLTDNELLCKFAVSAAVFGGRESRETRKLARRAATKVQFFDTLNKHGGWLKSQAVAQTLQVTRQTVNNHVQKRKLLAIQEGNDYCYPAFQFTEGQKIPHFEEVMDALGDVSAEAACSFFLNRKSLANGKADYPYALLRDGVSGEELEEILRDAELFMSGIPS